MSANKGRKSLTVDMHIGKTNSNSHIERRFSTNIALVVIYKVSGFQENKS